MSYPIPYFSHVGLESELVAQLCLTLCDPMNRSTPGLPVQHQPPEFTQTRIHRVSDAIQPSHPWSSPSPPAPNPSQHQSLPMSQLFATLEVKSLSRVRLFATPWTSSLPGSFLHGILQARVLEWVATFFSRGSSRPRDRTRVSCIPGRRFNL